MPTVPARFRAPLAQGLMAAALGLAVAGLQAQPVKTEHVTAELVARQAGVAPGQTVTIGLRLQHIPHWHTYWRNPGDSGLPTTLSWTLPAGAQAGAIDWPAPKRLPVGPLVNYGYEGDLLLPLSFRAPADAQPGSSLALQAEANWLVCAEVCIPESAKLTLQLPVLAPAQAAPATALAPMFDAAAQRRAQPLAGWQAEVLQSGTALQLRLTPAAGASAGSADLGALGALGASDAATTAGAAQPGLPPVQFFPYAEQLTEAARHRVYRVGQGYLIELGLGPGAKAPAEIQGIVVAQAEPSPWGAPSAEFTAPVREVPALALPAGATLLADASTLPTAAGADAGEPGAQTGLLAALALAFVGGMLLNLMPCVFPVLSIKLLGLARQHDAPAALRVHAIAYSAGVVLSFLALAGVLLALRAAGGAVGWGFQLQSPGVVFALALLFAGLGLNLLGVFEVGQLMPQRLAGWRSQQPVVEAAGSGVLAVLAASPCTAPFMGAALGFALTQSAPWALAVFAALGLGMALPYALLVVAPGWRHRLPRPGPWMLRLKQALAFPMLATVVWLLWVLGLQTDVHSLAKAMLALLALAMAAWAVGLWRAAARPAWLASGLTGLALLAVLAWAWPPETEPGSGSPASAQAGTSDQTQARAGRPTTAETGTAVWQPYSDAALQAHLAQGKTVFVDFTAAWCVSCQVNKQLVLTRADVLADFDRAGVVLMRADWTRRDAEISAAITRLGRSGVPVYLLQQPGQPPQLLPEVLTAGLVRNALAGLQAGRPG